MTDVDCDDIARACIVKYMREGNPGEAVASVSRAIYNKVKSGRTGIADVDEGSVNDEEDWFLVIILFLIFFGIPIYLFIGYILEMLGIVKPRPKSNQRNQSRRRNNDDDWIPPFFMGVAVLPAAVSRAVLLAEVPLAEVPLAEVALAEDGDAFDS